MVPDGKDKRRKLRLYRKIIGTSYGFFYRPRAPSLPPRAPSLLVLDAEEYHGMANGWLSRFYLILTDSLFPHFQQLATQPYHLDTRERIEEMTTTLHRRQIF